MSGLFRIYLSFRIFCSFGVVFFLHGAAVVALSFQICRRNLILWTQAPMTQEYLCKEFLVSQSRFNMLLEMDSLEHTFSLNHKQAVSLEIILKFRKQKSIIKLSSIASLKLKFTRTFETIDIKYAQAIADINSLLNVPIKTYIQQEIIMSRFVMHNIDKAICLEAILDSTDQANN